MVPNERVCAASCQPSPARIRELDVMRGLAVLGIFWVNIIVFGMPAEVYSYPTLFAHGHNANLVVWAINDVLIEGTMRGLFSLLFGASAMIFLNEERARTEGVIVVDRFYRRNLLLILFGMLHAYVLLWPYDVLYVYGVLGMLLFPLRKLPAMFFLATALAMLVFSDIEILPAEEDDAFEGIFSNTREEQALTEERMRNYLMPGIHQEMLHYRSDYASIFLSQVSDVIEQQSTTLYTTNFFDMGGMMMLGIALFKLGILTGTRSNRFYILLAVAGYTIGMVSRGIPVYNLLTHHHYSLGIAPFDGIDYTFARLPLVLGHMSLVILLCRVRWLNWLTSALAIVGKMALTSYILQTVIAVFVFYGFGLGLFGMYERYQLVYFCLAMWGFHIIFSLTWLHYFHQGPLEWLWRSLIYREWRPLLKTRK